jgi:hypothetical protein
LSIFAWSGIDNQRLFLARIYAASGYSLAGDYAEASKVLGRLMKDAIRDLKGEGHPSADVRPSRPHRARSQKGGAAGDKGRQQPGRWSGVLMNVATALAGRSPQAAIEAVQE